MGNRNKEDVTGSSSRSSQTIEIPTYSKEWIMVYCHDPTKIKYGRSVAKKLCNMEDTLGSLARLEKTLNANIKDRKYFTHAIAILTIISLRTSDGFYHNVDEFSKGKKNKEEISFVVCCENVVGCVIFERILRLPQIPQAATSNRTTVSSTWCIYMEQEPEVVVGFGNV